MRIAVIVAAFNVAPFLRQTIQSVIDQTHTEWSLIVVDDGSTDATGAITDGFRDKRISLIRQDNAGVSAARNRGIGHVMGNVLSSGPDSVLGSPYDAVLFLDGDDWLALDALSLLASTLAGAPWAVAACGRYARVGADRIAWLSPPPPNGCLLEQLLMRNLFANGGHLLIRREAIADAGAFRRDLSYGEDWEFWTRLALRGEFVAAQSRAALLFVRERPGSAYLSRATDAGAYRPAMDAIHGNPEMANRLGHSRLALLKRRAEAETAWAVGRELIRHGRLRDGQRWLGRSLHDAPNFKRLMIIGLSWARLGPFRRYQRVG